jgi:hypothetical protein
MPRAETVPPPFSSFMRGCCSVCPLRSVCREDDVVEYERGISPRRLLLLLHELLRGDNQSLSLNRWDEMIFSLKAWLRSSAWKVQTPNLWASAFKLGISALLRGFLPVLCISTAARVHG